MGQGMKLLVNEGQLIIIIFRPLRSVRRNWGLVSVISWRQASYDKWDTPYCCNTYIHIICSHNETQIHNIVQVVTY